MFVLKQFADLDKNVNDLPFTDDVHTELKLQFTDDLV